MLEHTRQDCEKFNRFSLKTTNLYSLKLKIQTSCPIDLVIKMLNDVLMHAFLVAKLQFNFACLVVTSIYATA